jgi:molybdate transport system ATP-binding protein
MQITITDLQFQISRERSLTIDRWVLGDGENAIVCGANGSGKSALSRLLTGKLPVTIGEIHFSCPEKVAHVSFELEEEILAEDRYNNDSEFMEGGVDHGRTAAEVIGSGSSLQSICQLLGIDYLLERPFKAISTGEARKVLIARALMSEPELLILDEPFNGLDIRSRQEMDQLFNQMVIEGTQLLLFDFYHDDLPESIDHLIYVHEGRIALQGTRKEVTASSEWKQVTDYQVQLPHHLPDCYQYEDLDPDCPFVKTVGLEVAYDGKTVFKGLDWTFQRGEQWRISGPNGSGKSTMLGMISGDNPKAYGKDITLFGVKRGSGESIWDIKRHFGLMSSSLHRDYRVSASVLEVVVSGFYDSIGLYDKPTETQWRIAREWLELLGLKDRMQSPFSILSFGEQRQVLIVRAMVKLPMILLLDEPCLGLDAANRALVLALVDYIVSNSQTHLLFVSHDYQDELSCLNRSLEFVPEGDHYRAIISSI